MKKFIVLSLGFSLFAAGLMLPLTEASRDAYHAYMTQPENIADYRHYTEGLSQNRLRTFILDNRRTRIQATLDSDYKQPRNYRGSRLNFSQGSRAEAVDGRALRPSTDRIAPNTRRSVRTTYAPRVVITPALVDQVQSSLYTYENDKFSLLLPVGWNLEDATDEVHVYSNSSADYTLRVKYFAQNTCGSSLGFATCAAQLGKSENYRAVGGAGKLEITSKIIRDTRKTDTVLNRLAVTTDTYTEQFTALFPFEGEQTLSRYFVAAPEGGVFLIESSASYYEAPAYTEITKRVFDSFRIYPEGYGLEVETSEE